MPDQSRLRKMSRRVIPVALSEGQLDALVAPIALYPDGLLSEILMASTYPVEVVEAARWVDVNKNLKGDLI